MKETNDAQERGLWPKRFQFILSCIGLSVGIGNVWRFPYVAYENGGGTFQMAYVVLLVLLGMPLYFMEVARGQFSKLGPIAVWRSCPVAIGVGWAMTTVSLFAQSFYAVIIAYTLVYIVSSFTSELPWASCQQWWGADQLCYVRSHNISSGENRTVVNFGNDTLVRQTASEQYWEKYVLNIAAADGMSQLGSIQWKLVIALAFTWSFVFISMFKGVKSMGKALYVTVTFPYIVLLVLLIQGLMLDGAIDGIKYFFTPKWDKLLEIQVWKSAAEQVMFSLGIAFGTLTALGSYNQFHNKCHIDVIIIALTDFATSLVACAVVFAVLGNLSKQLEVNIDGIFEEGQGLAFIIFPEIITKLPVPQIWCFLFFTMLFMLGINSLFTVYETAWTTIFDEFPKLRKFKNSLYVLGIFAFFCFDLVFVTAGGQYVINLFDSYVAVSRTLIAFAEVVAIMWLYGIKRFFKDIEYMLGFYPNVILYLCWGGICPVLILCLTILSWINFTPPAYGNYDYPQWAHSLGWIIAIFPLAQIPACAIWILYQALKKNDVKKAFQPTEDWGPAEPMTYSETMDHIKMTTLKENIQSPT